MSHGAKGWGGADPMPKMNSLRVKKRLGTLLHSQLRKQPRYVLVWGKGTELTF